MEIGADHTGVGFADPGDADGVEHPGQSGLAGSLDAVGEFFVGTLSKAFHLLDLIPVTVQMVDVSEIMDITGGDELLQGHL